MKPIERFRKWPLALVAACLLLGGIGAASRIPTLEEYVGVPGKTTVINLVTYGCKFDGVTDDSAKINAAIQALPITGGGRLLGPSGVSLINSPIIVDRQLSLECVPWQYDFLKGSPEQTTTAASGTTFLWGGGAAAMIQVAPTASTSGVNYGLSPRFENVILDGNNVATIGFQFDRMRHGRLHDCVVMRCTTGYWLGSTSAFDGANPNDGSLDNSLYSCRAMACNYGLVTDVIGGGHRGAYLNKVYGFWSATKVAGIELRSGDNNSFYHPICQKFRNSDGTYAPSVGLSMLHTSGSDGNYNHYFQHAEFEGGVVVAASPSLTYFGFIDGLDQSNGEGVPTVGANSILEWDSFGLGSSGSQRWRTARWNTDFAVGKPSPVLADTDGFFWAPAVNGMPTGVPAVSQAGCIPVRLDTSTTPPTWRFYQAGAWH